MSAWLESFFRDPDAHYAEIVLAALVALAIALLLRAIRARGEPARVRLASRVVRCGLLAAVLVAAVTAFAAVLRREGLQGWMLFAHVMAAGAIVAALPFYALSSYARTATGMLALLAGISAIAPIWLAMLPAFGTPWQHRLVGLHRYAALLFFVCVLLNGRARALRAAR